jgi:preprotein translocase subunit SecG
MTNLLNYIQITTAVMLIIFILLQNRGSGLGSAFGGEGNIYMTKRGAEKTIFILTIITAVIFLGLGVLRIFIQQ